jgi:predicted O-linked N-acetylglucosamine transferase (SPINDLY family)
VAALNDEQLAELLRRDRIDVAVDLSMHLAGTGCGRSRAKPAPVQVTWLAYTAGTGLASIDYRLSDPHLDPPLPQRDAVYAERTVRLPATFWCYDPIVRDTPMNVEPPADAERVRNASDA